MFVSVLMGYLLNWTFTDVIFRFSDFIYNMSSAWAFCVVYPWRRAMREPENRDRQK